MRTRLKKKVGRYFKFHDYEDMLEGIWHMDYPKYGLYADANNGGASMWDNYEVLPTRLKREDDLDLAMKLVKASLLQVGSVAATTSLVPVWRKGISACSHGKKTKKQLRCRDMEWWMKRRKLPSCLRQRVHYFERQRWAAMGG